MLGFNFTPPVPTKDRRTPFERLLELFTEVVTHTSGDVEEAMDWMRPWTTNTASPSPITPWTISSKT